MGIVNATPDSFTDGGRFLDPSAAIAQGHRLIEGGAAILDIGGESTRPGATPVPPDEEIRRVVPVIEGLAGAGVALSIDTRNATTMRAALKAGATIVNDVSALTHDPKSLTVAAASPALVALMHMRGTPETMQADPVYTDVVAEVREYLAGRIAACEAAGIPRARIALDPGIGFGKTAAHNDALIAGLPALTDLGCPILMGLSGKMIRRDAPKSERLAGSIAGALRCIQGGASILRVHDVAEHRAALSVWRRTAKPG
jgi:dihydropteroate synthase